MNYCPRCGKPITDEDNFCLNCGMDLSPRRERKEIQGVEIEQKAVEISKSTNPVETTMPETIGSKSTVKPRKNKKLLKIVGIILVVLILISRCSSRVSKKQADDSTTSAPVPTAMPTSTASTKDNAKTLEDAPKAVPVHVFYIDLAGDISSYDGKYIETTVPVKASNISSSGRISVRDRLKNEIEIYTEDDSLYEKRDKIDYITVFGRVEKDNSDANLRDVTVAYAGQKIPETYANEVAAYEEIVKEAKIAARNDFIEVAVSPSWNDLSRYPDSYEGQPLKLSVYITDVESDGLLSNGTVTATYNGGEIKIYDHRELREPRLRAGDSIVIYAKGSGITTTKTVVSGSGLFGSNLGADVVGTRDVPSVDMVYTDKDNLDRFGATDSSEDDDVYYQAGKNLAEKVNELMAG